MKYASFYEQAEPQRGGMRTELSRIVGLRVKRAREASGLTQSQLAERIDRTKEAVSNIERGVSLPGLDTLQAICDVTGIPLSAVVEAVGDDGEASQDVRAELNSLFGRLSDRDQSMLAVAYLRAATTPGYVCGLDGGFDVYDELRGWLERGHELAKRVAAMRPGTLRYQTVGTTLPLACLIEGQGGGEVRMVVIHPLWRHDASALSRLLGSTARSLDKFVDTFDLERRPLKALQLAKSTPFAPDAAALPSAG